MNPTSRQNDGAMPRYHRSLPSPPDLVEELGDVDFEPPHPAAASPPRSAHGPVVHMDGPYPLAELGPSRNV
jgi:hypothetical protein